MYLEAIISMFVLALFFGILLVWASKRFEVKEDPKIIAVKEALPGVDCGACGYPSCAAFAAAVVSGEAKYDGCKVGREKVACNVAEIMGIDTGSK